MLTELVKGKIKEHALKERPRECCGVVIKNQDYQAFPCKNLSRNGNLFSLSPQDYLQASLKGKVEAVYHSHLDKMDFSEYDKQQSKIHNVKYLLYNIKKDRFNLFNPAQNSSNKYCGIKFQIGVTDCYSIVKKYYKEELNIDLGEYCRDDRWKETNPGYFEKNRETEGFKEINLDELKKNDLILFSFRGKIGEHIAIYLGDETILHQPQKQLSRIDLLDSYKPYFFMAGRHKNFL